MHPDPAKRLSPGTARDANFLSDPLLTDEQARRVLIRFLNPNRPVNPDQDDEEPLDRKGRGSGSADANHSGNGAALSSDPTSGGQPDQADPAALGGKPGSLPSEAADEDFRLEQAKAKAEAERQHFMEIEAVARAQADGSLEARARAEVERAETIIAVHRATIGQMCRNGKALEVHAMLHTLGISHDILDRLGYPG